MIMETNTSADESDFNGEIFERVFSEVDRENARGVARGRAGVELMQVAHIYGAAALCGCNSSSSVCYQL